MISKKHFLLLLCLGLSSCELLSVVETGESSSISSEASSSVSSNSLTSQPDVHSVYNGYYSSLVSWTDGEDLKSQLHTIISGNGYKAISYNDPNWETNQNADRTSYDFEYVDVIYSATDLPKDKTNTGWQREHCWPASLMTGSTTGNAVKYLGRSTDFHNLWAANTSGNTSRGNKNYGMADKSDASYTSFLTSGSADGYAYDSTTFEPGNKDKGQVARAIFYMATMYCEDEFDSYNNVTMKGLKIVENKVDYVAGNSCAFAIGNLSTLLTWSEYPVSEAEVVHNESVYSHVYSALSYAQGNRNPFVDFPELVDYVFGSKKNQSGSLDALTPSVVTLGRYTKEFNNYAIKSAKREYNYGETFSNNDFKVVSIAKDFSLTNVTTATCSYSGHTWGASDGTSANITVQIDSTQLSYSVTLIQSGECNTNIVFDKSPINNSQVNKDFAISLGGYQLYWNISASSGYTISNNSSGGIKVGSGTYPVSKLTIKTKNSYKVNAAFIQAYAGTKSSSYTLKIKIGDYEIPSIPTVTNNSASYAAFGASLGETKEGIVSFEFSGGDSLYLKQISLNIVS